MPHRGRAAQPLSGERLLVDVGPCEAERYCNAEADMHHDNIVGTDATGEKGHRFRRNASIETPMSLHIKRSRLGAMSRPV
jgi:hypothetical protein